MIYLLKSLNIFCKLALRFLKISKEETIAVKNAWKAQSVFDESAEETLEKNEESSCLGCAII